MGTLLKWDEDGQRFYETGTKMGVLYVKNSSGAYPNGVAWSGLTGVTQSPEGAEANDLYADDIKYLSMRSAETLSGTITAYQFPEEFEQCDGYASPASGLTIGQQARKSFGLCYRTVLGNDTDGDAYGYKLHLIYGCTASPSERAYQTVNDSPEAIEFSWEFDTTPVNVEGYKPTSLIELDSEKIGSTKMAAIEAILYGTEGTYTATSDSTPQANKTYYTKSGDVYSEFTGQTFDNGTTYYVMTGGVAARLPLPNEIISIVSEE